MVRSGFGDGNGGKSWFTPHPALQQLVHASLRYMSHVTTISDTRKLICIGPPDVVWGDVILSFNR